MKKTRLNDILCWVITLCVIFMGGAVVHQMHYHTQENGLWVTIPFAIAIIAVVILNFTEEKD